MGRRDPFPLQWPSGYARTKSAARTHSRFGHRGQVGLASARDRLLRELRALGAINFVITTDLPVRLDGLPYANGQAPDPGVAVWFALPDSTGVMRERTFACDRWRSHAENMTAIAKTIEALRGLDRWGCADVVERAMGGFMALPSGIPDVAPWREVLMVPGSADGLDPGSLLAVVRHRHRELMKLHHPDLPHGNAELMVAINLALSQAEAELEQRSGQ